MSQTKAFRSIPWVSAFVLHKILGWKLGEEVLTHCFSPVKSSVVSGLGSPTELFLVFLRLSSWMFNPWTGQHWAYD